MWQKFVKIYIFEKCAKSIPKVAFLSSPLADFFWIGCILRQQYQSFIGPSQFFSGGGRQVLDHPVLCTPDMAVGRSHLPWKFLSLLSLMSFRHPRTLGYLRVIWFTDKYLAPLPTSRVKIFWPNMLISSPPPVRKCFFLPYFLATEITKIMKFGLIWHKAPKILNI